MQYTGEMPAGVPLWDLAWPGRAKSELDHLVHLAAGTVEIDEVSLSQGVLRVELPWTLSDGKVVRLKATFPDSFPRMRPHVQLLGSPDDFPLRHVGPNGEICLLGRDSRLWLSRWTLAGLLYTNLESALLGNGEEDPQGEPLEVWWNGAARSDLGNFLLVDSAWDLDGYDTGLVEILYTVRLEAGVPRFQGAVNKIWSGVERTSLLAERTTPLPPALLRHQITLAAWSRNDGLPLPNLDRITDLVRSMDHKGRYEQTPFGTMRISLTVQRSELSQETTGDAFICLLTIRDRQQKRETGHLVPVLRAGSLDLGYRVPSTAVLRGSKIAVFGLGALGSPLAVELARNQVGALHLIDHDIVEPGNTVRWALGASAWGKRKAEALANYIRGEYPRTNVETTDINIGLGSSQGAEATSIEHAVLGADIVVDASASTGVTRYLSDICRQQGKVLVSLAGTVSLKGGTVSIYPPGAACPICREFAYHSGELKMAPGAEDYAELTQPPGCAENTFTGASFDLQELSLQAVRVVVSVLSEGTPENSVVQTLSLHDGSVRTLPAWSVHHLHRSIECSCGP